VIKEFIGTVHQELSSGSKIDLYGLGTFKVKDTAARNRRNPQNGNIIPVPAGKKVSFKAAPALKAAILH
jgi:nucleoid DNA-binding protein